MWTEHHRLWLYAATICRAQLAETAAEEGLSQPQPTGTKKAAEGLLKGVN
jgi:hypothetical protein